MSKIQVDEFDDGTVKFDSPMGKPGETITRPSTGKKYIIGDDGLTAKPVEYGKVETLLHHIPQGLLGLSDEARGAFSSPVGAIKQLGRQMGISNPDKFRLPDGVNESLIAEGKKVGDVITQPSTGKQFVLQDGGIVTPYDADIAEYKKARDLERKILEQSRNDNPITSYAGEIGGGILPAIGTGGAGIVSAGRALRAGKSLAPSLGKLVLKGGVQGAFAGGLQGVGSSKGETGTDLIKDAAIGGTLGGIAGSTFPTIGAMFGKAKDAVVGSVGFLDDLSNSYNISKKTGDFLYGKTGIDQSRKTLNQAADKIRTNLTDDMRPLYDEVSDVLRKNANKTVNAYDEIAPLIKQLDQVKVDHPSPETIAQVNKLKNELLTKFKYPKLNAKGDLVEKAGEAVFEKNQIPNEIIPTKAISEVPVPEKNAVESLEELIRNRQLKSELGVSSAKAENQVLSALEANMAKKGNINSSIPKRPSDVVPITGELPSSVGGSGKVKIGDIVDTKTGETKRIAKYADDTFSPTPIQIDKEKGLAYFVDNATGQVYSKPLEYGQYSKIDYGFDDKIGKPINPQKIQDIADELNEATGYKSSYSGKVKNIVDKLKPYFKTNDNSSGLPFLNRVLPPEDLQRLQGARTSQHEIMNAIEALGATDKTKDAILRSDLEEALKKGPGALAEKATDFLADAGKKYAGNPWGGFKSRNQLERFFKNYKKAMPQNADKIDVMQDELIDAAQRYRLSANSDATERSLHQILFNMTNPFASGLGRVANKATKLKSNLGLPAGGKISDGLSYSFWRNPTIRNALLAGELAIPSMIMNDGDAMALTPDAIRNKFDRVFKGTPEPVKKLPDNPVFPENVPQPVPKINQDMSQPRDASTSPIEQEAQPRQVQYDTPAQNPYGSVESVQKIIDRLRDVRKYEDGPNKSEKDLRADAETAGLIESWLHSSPTEKNAMEFSIGQNPRLKQLLERNKIIPVR